MFVYVRGEKENYLLDERVRRYFFDIESKWGSKLSFNKSLVPIIGGIHDMSLKNILVTIYWHIASLCKGKYFYEYRLKLDDEIVAYARVCPKIYVFPFIPNGGYHIGPCATKNAYRGNGFYPLLLKYIMYFKNKDLQIFTE